VVEFVFKDKFLTQSAPGVHRKLQKTVAEGEKSLDQLMQLAMSVYCNRELTKKSDKDKKTPGPYHCTQGAPHPTGSHYQDMLSMWIGRMLL
jgi:hypothetical protein